MPHRRAPLSSQYDEVQGRLHSIESEFDTTRTAASAVRQKFAEVRAKRYKLFMSAFKVVSENIDPTYKSLTKVAGMLNGGTAYLSLEDPDEPCAVQSPRTLPLSRLYHHHRLPPRACVPPSRLPPSRACAPWSLSPLAPGPNILAPLATLAPLPPLPPLAPPLALLALSFFSVGSFDPL